MTKLIARLPSSCLGAPMWHTTKRPARTTIAVTISSSERYRLPVGGYEFARRTRTDLPISMKMSRRLLVGFAGTVTAIVGTIGFAGASWAEPYVSLPFAILTVAAVLVAGY